MIALVAVQENESSTLYLPIPQIAFPDTKTRLRILKIRSGLLYEDNYNQIMIELSVQKEPILWWFGNIRDIIY